MSTTIAGVYNTQTIDNTERLRRQQAVDGAVAQLSYNTYVGSDGKTVNLLSKYELGDLQAGRGPIADQIRALLTKSPALSSAEIKTQAAALVNQFRAQFPVAPRVVTTTAAPISSPADTLSTRDRLLRLQARDSSLGQLSYNAFPDASGKTVNLLRSGYTLSQINEKRAPFTAQINALYAKQPPLTPDQIRAEAGKIINQFRAQFGGAATAAAGATTATGDEAARIAARDAALAKLRGITSGSYTEDGKTETYDFNDLPGMDAMDEERGPYEAQINALFTRQPPYTAAEITQKSEAIIAEFQELGTLMAVMVEGMMMQLWFASMPKPGFGFIG
ncbi:MAG: hypothetical protein M3Y59_05620 [Myxococcota bacterium]|nr:hypothetical protein [Myxococcota bacterium]